MGHDLSLSPHAGNRAAMLAQPGGCVLSVRCPRAAHALPASILMLYRVPLPDSSQANTGLHASISDWMHVPVRLECVACRA